MNAARPSGGWRGCAALLLSLALGACTPATETEKKTQPPRPAGVPASAVWVGGTDGGVFFEMRSFDAGSGRGRIKVFHPSGDMWFDGAAVLEPKGANFDPAREKNAWTGWDGTDMHLTEGRRLRAAQ
jgi:hypothetical protein